MTPLSSAIHQAAKRTCRSVALDTAIKQAAKKTKQPIRDVRAVMIIAAVGIITRGVDRQAAEFIKKEVAKLGRKK